MIRSFFPPRTNNDPLRSRGERRGKRDGETCGRHTVVFFFFLFLLHTCRTLVWIGWRRTGNPARCQWQPPPTPPNVAAVPRISTLELNSHRDAVAHENSRLLASQPTVSPSGNSASTATVVTGPKEPTTGSPAPLPLDPTGSAQLFHQSLGMVLHCVFLPPFQFRILGFHRGHLSRHPTSALPSRPCVVQRRSLFGWCHSYSFL